MDLGRPKSSTISKTIPTKRSTWRAKRATRNSWMRCAAALGDWIADTDDKGQYPRSDAAIREVVERYPRDWLKGPEFAVP